MALIKFTRREGGGKVTRSFGDFVITANRHGVVLDGVIQMSPAVTGDNEFRVLTEELAGAWKDYKDMAGENAVPDETVYEFQINEGVSAKAGRFAVVHGHGLLVKMAVGRATDFVCKQVAIRSVAQAKAFAKALSQSVGHRGKLRVVAERQVAS